jgi:lysophospholipase L1-like esterase
MSSSGTTLSPRLRVLALVAPSLLFGLVLTAGEIATRWLLPPLNPLETFVRDPHQRMGFTDRRSVRIFRFDPELFWRLEPGLRDVVWDFTLVSTNDAGLRHPRELEAKPPGGFRIVCAGDSVTFGYRVPTVWADAPGAYSAGDVPYPRLLEQRLRAANPDREIEVIGLAVPGYSSYQGRLWLARELRRLQPDLVTTLYGWNDVNVRLATDADAMPAEWWRVALRGSVAASQGLLRISEALQEPAVASLPRDADKTLRVPREAFVANHLEMNRQATATGARFVAIAPVYRDPVSIPGEAPRIAGHRDALREALGTRGIPWLEIPELTEAAHPANAPLFGEVIHPNARGHRLLTDRLLGFLDERGLLGELRVGPGPKG